MTGSLCDVLPSAAALLGVAGAADRMSVRDAVGERARVAVVLIDGMGHHLLPAMAPHAPFLAAVLDGTRPARREELQCTFPSTTPTSLVSLGTGAQPGAHGVLGFTVNVPGTDRVLTHIGWGTDPDPRQWQPLPTWFERVAAAGLGSAVVLPQAFAGSGLTDAAYRGARFCGLADGPDRRPDPADAADRLLGELRAQPGLVFGYTAVLDTAAHLCGVDSPRWRAAAAEVDGYLQRIAAGLPSDAALLVTADHGALNAGRRFDVALEPALADGVRVIAGEPRVRYLHTREGAADDVAAAWRATLGDAARVSLRDEAVALGWFGPVPAAHLPRIGDVVVECTGTDIVLASGHEPPEVAELIGFHGGRTPAETAIPLLTFTR